MYPLLFCGEELAVDEITASGEAGQFRFSVLLLK